MKRKKTILVSLIAFTLMSFTYIRNTKTTKLTAGTYSTCGCADSKDSAQKIGLIIHENNTFHYFDNTTVGKSIDIKGNWTLDESTVILKDYPAGSSIDNTWEIDKNGNCLKSRKGLSVIRLCNLKACE